MIACKEGLYFVLVFICLHIKPAFVQAPGQTEQRKPFFERLRRLDEQFRRFQEVTLTRLQGIAENYNISYNINSRFQVLTEQYENISRVLNDFQATVDNDLNSLKFWTKKLQKKTKKLDLKVTALEKDLSDKGKQSLRENKEHKSLLFNLTQELQIQKKEISSFSEDREKVQRSLTNLQDALKNQGDKMVQLEVQVRSMLQNDALSSRVAAQHSNQTPQILHPGRQDPLREQEQKHPKTSLKLQFKHSRGKKAQARLQPPEPTKPQLQQPAQAPLQSESQSQLQPSHQAVTQPPQQPLSQSQLQSEPQSETQPLSQPQAQSEPQSETQPLSQPQAQSEPQSETQPLSQPQAQSEPRSQLQQYLQHEFLEESETQQPADLAELPLRHKIPRQQQAPKKAGTICNVKSMLIFPGPSIQNYATFRKGFSAGIHELSVCTWLRVEGGYLGTLLSYATEENDNKLVLYGRNSSERASVDFVIGDPAYRELPAEALLDNKWHHLCVIWSSIEGKFWHYTDRWLTSTGSKFQKGYEIPPGGSVVLGQEQDSVGGGFDAAEAFVGRLAGFAVWNRALDPGEVSGIATGKGLPRGTILTLDDLAAVNGAVQHVECGCLEHCL
ncbi:pentraxin-4 [Lepisosteus oculatus]|uniref:pentraxin-4 n=1 Tax=Lepisosteus oculatus TaxID=7918 RepID=UPI0035F52F24